MSLTLLTLCSIVPAFGQEIELTNIHTSSSTIHVGDSVQFNATIINNSPNTISYNSGCMSPLSATFDNNIVLGQAMGCLAIYVQNLKPGENITVVGPSNSISYIANSAGITNANVTFSYTMENKSQNSVSKPFTFDILEKASIPEFPSIALVIFALATLMSIVFVSQKNNLFKL
jgi:predicted secreted protein with PEFG-CTERM motif